MSNSDFAQLLENSEGLTEQFKTNASQLFEQAVEARVTEETEKRVSEAVEQAIAEQLEQRLADQKKELAEQVADAAESFVDEEIEKRAAEIRESVTAEFTEKFNQLVEEKTTLEQKLTDAEAAHEAEKEKLHEAMEASAADLAVEKVAELREKLASYADYVAEQYVANHNDEIVSESKVWLADGILESVRNLFAQYGIGAEEADESYANQITKLTEERDTAYAELAEAIEAKFDLEKQLTESKKAEAFEDLTEGLTDIDRERVKSLMEGDSSNIETFKARVKTLAESFVSAAEKESAPAVSTVNVVTESAPAEPGKEEQKQPLNENVDPEVDYFVRMLQAGRGDRY